MVEYNVKTYEEAINVIEEVGILPLAPLIPDFPSLNFDLVLMNWERADKYPFQPKMDLLKTFSLHIRQLLLHFEFVV
ncbi:hypothetical protein GCM10009865_05710 [Aeromicrobium ponti]|uniref:Uncharacterized protein n=1 Tax=Cytobacillus oceanisediminis TaxID=665099 RepID=A0A562K712_9BACI|nr:hypothetical protein IQ19_00474 [Cytobacillus oceanisediminis]